VATIPPDGIELAHAYRADLDSQLKVTGTSAVPGRQQQVLDSAFAESLILGNQLEQNAHALCANRFGLVGLGRSTRCRGWRLAGLVGLTASPAPT
jgi:hypothetical protein